MPLFSRLVLFIQGVIALPEQITVVGDTRWEQSTEHCRAFSTIAMQLLHDLGALFYRLIIMGKKLGPKRVCDDSVDKNHGNISEGHHTVHGVAERSKHRSDDPLETDRRHSPTRTAKITSATPSPKTWMGKH
jgi:hypothetical protein